MQWLMIILVILILLLIILIFRLMVVISQNDFKLTITFLKRYILVIFFGLFTLYGVTIIQSFNKMEILKYSHILFLNHFIQLLFFIAIFKYTINLLSNLSLDVIFDDQNTKLTKNIGFAFIYLSITQIIAGLIMGITDFINNRQFHFTSNPTIILFIAIGLILCIVSFILKKAIILYKENSLTI